VASRPHFQASRTLDKKRAPILGVRHYAVASTCPPPDPPPLRFATQGRGRVLRATTFVLTPPPFTGEVAREGARVGARRHFKASRTLDKKRASILGVRHYAVASTCFHPDPPPLRFATQGRGRVINVRGQSGFDLVFWRLKPLRTLRESYSSSRCFAAFAPLRESLLSQGSRSPTSGGLTRVGQCETGIEAGAPAFFRKNNRNFAGCVLLALRDTVWMSVGDS